MAVPGCLRARKRPPVRCHAPRHRRHVSRYRCHPRRHRDGREDAGCLAVFRRSADHQRLGATLEWQAPFGATHYELEAGTAPGLSNIERITLTEPRFALDGVPSGAYYLRVRVINTIGKCAASPEVLVIVP